MTGENARDRAVDRYYHTWVESSSRHVPAHARTAEGQSVHDPARSASHDTTLVAFAQLGCLRLDAARGFVSLVGSTHQHVLAEATRTRALTPEPGLGGTDEELCFGSASLPRSQGLTEAALDAPEYTAVGSDGRTRTASALVIRDVTTDDRYKHDAHASHGVAFYCGIPIVSNAGHHVGVFTVTDDKPRDGLAYAELEIVQDLARVVMSHLERITNEPGCRRGETTVRGLEHDTNSTSSTGGEPGGDTEMASHTDRRTARAPSPNECHAAGDSPRTITPDSDTRSMDDAKSTFVANISHELRSPLHGILGSVEFLQDTPLDAFQSSLTLAVNTCAKTLLDVVEHVLDYAKINHVSRKLARPPSTRRGSDAAQADQTALTLADDLDLASLFEEVVEAVYAGQTFRSAGRHRRQDSPLRQAQATPDDSSESTKDLIQQGSDRFSGAVRVILDIEHASHWWVHTGPGAIRRVVMNILGNALKYTEKGAITVALAAGGETSGPSPTRTVCLSVKDSGRGMSADYLRHHAFTPFSQESQFSAGTGLGLTIVRQIVDALDGSVDLQSEENVGTEIKVWVTLPLRSPPPPSDDPDDQFRLVTQRTTGMRLCMLEPKSVTDRSEPEGSQSELPAESVESSLRRMAGTWFGMRTLKARSMVGVSTDFFVYAEPPPIDYLLHHHGEHAQRNEVPLIIMATNAFESASLVANGINRLTELGRVLEVIAQPCGPQKFAKALHRCLARLDALARDPDRFHRDDPVHVAISDTKAVPGSPLTASEHQPHSEHEDEPHAGSGQDRDGGDTLQDSPGRRSASPARNAGAVGPQPDTAGGQDVPRPTTVMAHHPGPPSRLDTVAAGAGDGGPPTSLADKPPVLLVDDNDINLSLLVAFMRKAKHPYETAKDGLQAAQAYERASEHPGSAFKYVLMDVSMPVMDGIASTRTIRRYETKAQIREPATIVAVTGLGSESTQREMFEAGADYFLAKPASLKELMKLLQS